MLLSLNLSTLSLQQMVTGATQAVGYQAGVAAVAGVTQFLTQKFVDQSQKLSTALLKANQQAWRALELALTGDGLWDRCKRLMSTAEEIAFRDQLRPFLDECPMAELSGKDQFRADCLSELRAARKQGALSQGRLDPKVLARKVGAFARFDNPDAILQAEEELVAQMGDELLTAGYENLAAVVSLRPRGRPPILLMAGRFFFRRCVEADEELYRGLTFAKLESLQQEQSHAMGSLHQLLEQQGESILKLLDSLQKTVDATHATTLDIREEQQRQSEQSSEIYQTVVQLQSRLDLMHRELRPQDSLSIRNDNERRLVRELVAQYRGLPEEQRQELPALLNAIGKLEVAAGDFQAAQADFNTVAGMVTEPSVQAEAHANAFRAALEQRNWETALDELRSSVDLDAARFAPFPLDKLIPERILGAGGFGVAYLCRHRYMKTDVVVKALLDKDLDCDVDALFSEAQVLRQLDHAAIIRIQDCGFAGVDETRPYLVMDYFAGQTMEAHVAKAPIAADDLVAIALQMAEGMQAAHTAGILHRDIKPANILIQQAKSTWEVKLIDFGLALRKPDHETLRATSATLIGSSIAGTMDYAAPEQMGKLTDVPITAASDIYGFARTCCYALFQTPQPLRRHWRSIPDGLADLLEACLEDHPTQRPQSFTEVHQKLLALTPEGKQPQPSPLPVVEPEIELPQLPPDPALASRQQALNQLAKEVAGCQQCDSLVKSRTLTVFGTGKLSPDFCFVGEAPGADEDASGEPFVGAGGKLLDRMINAMGMRREDVYICNLLKCRPPRNRAPLPDESANCKPYLAQQIGLVQPRMIITLGGSAAKQLLNTDTSVGRLRGQIHNYNGIPVLCTYHPAFLLPSRSPEKKKDVWADLQAALKHLGR